jgi:O-acetyl-ADP-ribose deacetylase (regulator of RNase III)
MYAGTINIACRNKESFDVFDKVFIDYPSVNVHLGSIMDIALETRSEAIVSPANSYGMMDGGVDQVYTDFFGPILMRNVQIIITNQWQGEQPVGTGFVAQTGNTKIPFCVHTPTMRVPMDIRGTDNVYQSWRACFRAVEINNAEQEHNPRLITSIACVPHGTGAGRMSYEASAQQMKLAINNWFNPLTINWNTIREREIALQIANS